MIKKLIKIIFLLLIFNLYNSIIFAFDITKYNNKEENIIIWCINKKNETIDVKINSKWKKYCDYKNIILPKKSHLLIFKELYWDNKTMIANRLALINFESAFNEYAISPWWDYWYIQIRWWKEYLWLIKESLYYLDARFIEQKINLCQKKLKIKSDDYDNIYKCLLMRHNWRKTLNNNYTIRWINTRNYYINYFKNNNEQKK